eukprot:NODE_605_length_1927_cov_140.128328_g484_i0.p1 GENE.NODE_605_length_1927_cov_140.128328_g484_i0~~NODE_605_length_1927_cov_140.128328_g484_i0.p1  ORF type:complete len:591 (+),score=174.84 NODE_605_length_1927_cov_140.128328_g484_i0:92-1864(+)
MEDPSAAASQSGSSPDLASRVPNLLRIKCSSSAIVHASVDVQSLNTALSDILDLLDSQGRELDVLRKERVEPFNPEALWKNIAANEAGLNDQRSQLAEANAQIAELRRAVARLQAEKADKSDLQALEDRISDRITDAKQQALRDTFELGEALRKKDIADLWRELGLLKADLHGSKFVTHPVFEAKNKDLADRIAALEDKLNRPYSSSGVSKDETDQLRNLIRQLRNDLTNGLLDAEQARNALATQVQAKCDKDYADAKLLQKVDRSPEFSEVQGQVKQNEADISELRALLSTLNNNGADAGTKEELDGIRAALQRLARDKADCGAVNGALGRLDRDKVSWADFEGFMKQFKDDENVTAGRFRCISCNRGSSGLYQQFEKTRHGTNEFPPQAPMTTSIKAPPQVSQRRGKRVPSATAESILSASAPAPGKIRPGSAPTYRKGSSQQPVFETPSNGQDRLSEWRDWTESEQAARSPPLLEDGRSPSPISPNAVMLASSMGASMSPTRGSVRRGSEVIGGEPSPVMESHIAKTAYHMGSDGRAYGGVLHPAEAGIGGGSPLDASLLSRTNTSLAETGTNAQGVTLASPTPHSK